jgi:hypothetical protein
MSLRYSGKRRRTVQIDIFSEMETIKESYCTNLELCYRHKEPVYACPEQYYVNIDMYGSAMESVKTYPS